MPPNMYDLGMRDQDSSIRARLIVTGFICFAKKTYCDWILIEGIRFRPFGPDIAEIRYNSNEDVSFWRKDVLWPDYDRGHPVPSFSGLI